MSFLGATDRGAFYRFTCCIAWIANRIFLPAPRGEDVKAMKKLFKKLFKSKIFRRLISFFVAAYIRSVHYTSRREIIIDEGAKPYARGDHPFVVAFWHGRLLMMPMLRPPGRGMHCAYLHAP